MPFAPGFDLALLVLLADALGRIHLVHFELRGESGGGFGQSEGYCTSAESESRAPSHIVWHAHTVAKTVRSRGPRMYAGQIVRDQRGRELSTGAQTALRIDVRFPRS